MGDTSNCCFYISVMLVFRAVNSNIETLQVVFCKWQVTPKKELLPIKDLLHDDSWDQLGSEKCRITSKWISPMPSRGEQINKKNSRWKEIWQGCGDLVKLLSQLLGLDPNASNVFIFWNILGSFPNLWGKNVQKNVEKCYNMLLVQQEIDGSNPSTCSTPALARKARLKGALLFTRLA